MSIETLELTEFTGPNLECDSIELLQKGLVGWRKEFIPVGLVTPEKVATDKARSFRLARSILTEGQISEITLRPRLLEPDNVTYDVIDGFHRSTALRLLAEEEPELLNFKLRACVRYGVTDQKLAEYRILATNVESVVIPRLAEWITDFYTATKWDSKGISVAQAFYLGSSEARSSRKFNLNPEEMEELKQFVRETSIRWNREPEYVRDILKVTSLVDPNIVRMIRVGETGEESVQITKLAAIIEIFPGVEFYGAQRAVLQYADTHDLTVKQIKNLILSVDSKLPPNISAEDGFEAIKDMDIFKPGASISKNSSIIKADHIQDDDSDEDESDIMIGAKADSDPLFSSRLDRSLDIDGEDVSEAAAETIKTLESRVKDLEKILKNVETGKDYPWWETAVYLSPIERQIMKLYFDDCMDESEIGSMINKTSLQVLSCLKSARAKYKEIKRRETRDGKYKELFGSARRGRPSNAEVAQRTQEQRLLEERFRLK